MKHVFHFVSTNCVSGLENVVINISMLLGNNYNFTYVSPNGSINYYLQKYNINHIGVAKLTPLSVRSVIKKYHPDIVHGHDVKASLYLAMNSHLCHKHHIRIISELHNDDPRMWKYSLRSIIYLLSSPYYDNIVTISNAVLNNYIFKREIINKTSVINNVVNPLRMKFYPQAEKKWDCIFLGRFVNQKDPIKFIKIIYKLKEYGHNNISAIMLGTGPLLNYSKNLVRSLNLVKNIRLCGFQDNPYKYLCESRVLVMPSKYEGFGLVALESLLCGTPVIASYTGGLRNIINNKCGGFASSIFKFCYKISLLLFNPKRYYLKSLNAKNRGHQLNDVNKFISSYNKIYS